MDRRDFLTGRRKKPSAPVAAFRTLSGLNPYAGPWTKNEVQHLLKRTMFGSTKADIDYFSSRTIDQAIDELLSPVASLPSPPLNDYSSATPDAAVAAGATWVNSPTLDIDINTARRASFKKWWTGVMIGQDRSIREKLTLFWADHFGTQTETIGLANFVYNHNTLLRQNGLGSFKQLVKSVTIDAGMLIFLNGYLNTASAPDENYARELQELFTLGKGPSVAYTEEDVRTAARVLTGWRINTTTFEVYFDASQHDTDGKSFSSYYNNATIAGRSGADGALEVDDLVNLLFSKEEVSKYICRCLYRWFVYYTIDAAAEANVIEPLAAAFRSSSYHIETVLSTLFKSEHFFDVLNQGCLIKSPVDNTIGCLREFGVVFPDAMTDYGDAYNMWDYNRNWFAETGQDIGDPPDVSGWPAYYQEPQYHEIWINSDTLPKRNQFTDTMVLNGYTRNDQTIMIDPIAFTKTLSNPGDPNILLEDALSILYRVPLSEASKLAVKQQILLSNQTSDYYWTNAWNAYMANPTDQMAMNVINSRLQSLYQYLMNLSEYQLS